MNKLLFNIAFLSSILIVLLSLSLFFVPNPIVKETLLGSILEKQERLESINANKIILIGGSNVSFGIESKRIQDSFKEYKVVNYAINFQMGLRFSLNHILNYINPGDIVILSPEYEYFYGDYFQGNLDLVAVLFDIYPDAKSNIEYTHWLKLLKYLPVYAAKKISTSLGDQLLSNFNKPNGTGIYDRKSFNKFGDAFKHWDINNNNINNAKKSSGFEQINMDILIYLKDYQLSVYNKNALLILMPPVINQTSSMNLLPIIQSIESELRFHQLPFKCSPYRYSLADSLFFNDYYHCNKSGVDARTVLLIDDLKSIIK